MGIPEQITKDSLAPKEGELEAMRKKFDKRFGTEQVITQVPKKQRQVKKLTYEDLLGKGLEIIKGQSAKYRKPLNIPFETAKKLWWDLFKAHLEAKGKEPKIEGNFGSIIEGMILYFVGSLKSPYKLHKGLYLSGETGVGKTDIFKVFRVFSETVNYRNFGLVNCEDLVLSVRVAKSYSILNDYKKGLWCFDDLAAEEATNVYGNYDDVVMTLLKHYYMNQFEKGFPPLATGNVSIEKLGERYKDPRFMDRFREMFTPVVLTGKSKRS